MKHIHLIGICGTAMAALAGMLKERGYLVSGSDAAAYPPMSDFLAALGIVVKQPYSGQNLQPRPDLVIVGNAISRGNPELEHVLDSRIPLRSLPEMLRREFLEGRDTLVVAGTHGKTTTTAMLSWIFEVAGRAPSFLVGGIAENFGSSYRLTKTSRPGIYDSQADEYFIIEGDEYDSAFFDKGPKFLHYFPQSLILTSVEFDHGDIYPDLEAVKTSFKRLVNLVPRRGKLIAWDGEGGSARTQNSRQVVSSEVKQNLDDCLTAAPCPVERYGFRDDSCWRITAICHEAARTSWSVQRNGQAWGHLEFTLAGEHNVLNATAAAALAAGHGIGAAEIAQALSSFRSVKRRLEVRAEIAGITIIDDFAHHPTAIAETLRALRSRYSGRRLWAVLEPRSNSLARNFFQQELPRSLALADRVVIADVFRAAKYTDSERLDVNSAVAQLQAMGVPAQHLPGADAIVAAITPELRAGDVIALLSNGAFGDIYEKLPKALAQPA